MFSLFPVINFGKTETIEKNLFSQNWKRFKFFIQKMIDFTLEAA
jgi:hypothetical protein